MAPFHLLCYSEWGNDSNKANTFHRGLQMDIDNTDYLLNTSETHIAGRSIIQAAHGPLTR